jgi:wobble nucleotide-excising tRNase
MSSFERASGWLHGLTDLMLQRIITIRNVGRFKNCAASGDVTFRRYTLVFAENARGKTTLCDILRSLFTNTPAIVIGRTTLGSPDPPEIQLLTANGNIAFRNGAWTAAYPDIAVFDGTYVRENVFAGDAVDVEHRRNLYRVIIGAQGVALAASLDDLDNQIKAKNAEIRDNRAQMQRHMAQGMTVEAFIALAQDPEIDARIAAKEQELQAARQADQLQQKAALSALTVPVFPAAFAELLAKTFANVAADAERRVSEHIARHRMQTRGETWITEGLQYIAEDSCPFCSQRLEGVGLIQDYRSFFSREYHALRQEVTGLKRQVDAAIGERAAAALEQTVLQNGNAAESWRRYCELAATELPESGRIGDVMGALRESAQALLDVKAGTPLDTVAPDDRFTQALGAFESLRTSFGTYNATVATANAVITARKRQAQAANVRDVESALARLKAQKARHTADVQALCDTDARLQAGKTTLEGDKATARQQLDAHTQHVITQYGQHINWYLERINASFRITTPTHTYRGGPPSTSYQIVINHNAVDLGDPATPPDRPSFKNTLSGGDRSTLALAFFFAQLEQDASRANKVVVFDDPFGSQDGFRRNHTVNQIYKCGQNCAQVVVLSHDPGFLHLLWERVAPADRKSLCMARIGEENTTIAEWDIERAVQARYLADLGTLQRFFSDGEGDPRDVIQKIRPALEAYCRNLYPTQFGEQETMGSIVGKIRDAGAAHPLSSIVDYLDELNIYCRRYHHGENPNAATEPVDDAELQGYVRRTLKLVGCLM